MTKPYTPRAKIQPLLDAMQENPDRIWSLDEAAVLMDVKRNGVTAMIAYAVAAGVIHRGTVCASVALSTRPFREGAMDEAKPRNLSKMKTSAKWTQPLDDIRIPRVIPNWTPPKMVCTR